MIRRERPDVCSASPRCPRRDRARPGDRLREPHVSEFKANAHRATGYDANERGDWSVAIDEYSRAIELDAAASDYEERAYAHSRLGDSLAAIADFTAAIELDPQSAAAHSQRALEYNILGRWADAIADLDRAIELRPERADQYNGRAFAHMNLGNWDQVVADASQAVDRAADDDPLIPIYLSNRATAYAKLGQPALALADFDRGIALDPANVTTHQNRLLLLVELGRLDEARAAAFALNADLASEPAEGHLLLADVLRAAGLFEEALLELDAAIDLDSDSAILLMARATAHSERGDNTAACVDFRSALSLASTEAIRAEASGALDRLERSGACLVGA